MAKFYRYIFEYFFHISPHIFFLEKNEINRQSVENAAKIASLHELFK